MKKIILISALFLFLIGCDDTNNVNDLDKVTIPSSNVSYSQHIQPVFNLKCNNTGCHNSVDRKAGISLQNHSDATADASVIFPGLPQNSRLVWAIQAQTGAKAMPPVGLAPLTKNQIDGIVTWIKEGAKNN